MSKSGNNKSFNVPEAVIVLVVALIVGVSGYAAFRPRGHNDTSNHSVQAGQSTKAGSNPAPNPGWTTVTFPPENLKLSFPPALRLNQPTQLSTSKFDASNKAYATSLGNGFTLQLVMINHPSTYVGYSNREPSTEESSFTSDGIQMYIVLNGEHNYLMVSTCAAKVCAYTAHSNSNDGMLVFANYSGQVKLSNGSVATTDQIPLSYGYTSTVIRVLGSLSY